MKVGFLLVVSNNCFFWRIEISSFAFCTRHTLSNIVQTEHHILRRHLDWSTVGRVQNVVRRQHKNLSFQHGSIAKRQVNSHLVTIEVGVECRTSKWVKLDSLSFNHLRLECLNTKTVQCRGTVQQNWVTFHYIFQNIPDNSIFSVNNLLGRFYRFYNTSFNQFSDNERFVQFSSHSFWNTTFVQFQRRTYDDYRTSRIVNTFTEQVLTETTLFTFQTVAQRLQRTVCISFCRICLS